MNIQLKIPEKIKLNNFELQKFIFINNALNDGWQIKKNNEKYIFTKNHENQKEIYLDEYLEKFIKNNLNIGNSINSINNI